MELPEELQQRIDNAKNSVDTLEVEANRLQKLLTSQKAELEVVNTEKKNAEDKIVLLKESLEKLIDENAKKTLESQNLDSLVKTSRNELTEIQLKARDVETANLGKTRELDQREMTLKVHEDDVNKRNIDLIEKENRYTVKVAKLEEALK